MPSWWEYLLGGQQAPVFPQGQPEPTPFRPMAVPPTFAMPPQAVAEPTRQVLGGMGSALQGIGQGALNLAAFPGRVMQAGMAGTPYTIEQMVPWAAEMATNMVGAGSPFAQAGAVGSAGGKPGIRAYHGSPHDFERFDFSKIGTGEGAQAYGHGLYMAESEAVAKQYRDALKQEGTPGRMYEVNIKAHPEQFLDWDKPLSQQSPHVQEALRNSPAVKQFLSSLEGTKNPELHPSRTGESIHDLVGAGALREAGIPGIRYLDQGSRVTPDVIKQAETQVNFLKDQAQKFPRDTGIPQRLANAQAHLEQQQALHANPTSNYVVFNDALIDILKKYGLIGMLGGTTAAPIFARQDQQ